MAKRRTSTIDLKTHLTKQEHDILTRAVIKVIKSVFVRERNKYKRRILMAEIADCGHIVWITANFMAYHE